MFAQEIAAKFSDYVGKVFKDWDDEWHVRRADWDRTRPVYVAADYGWTNPTVLLFIQADHWKRVHIISEYYQTHKSNEDIHYDLTNGVYDSRHPALAAQARTLYPDPEDPKTSSALANLMHWRVMGDTGGELRVRINLMRKWLKDENSHLPHGHVDRRPMTTVDPRCTNTIREFGAYRYPETKKEAGTVQSEHPLEKDNHCPEAWGRFQRGFFGEGALAGGGGRMKMGKAKVRR
jgi:hypothetical protein